MSRLVLLLAVVLTLPMAVWASAPAPVFDAATTFPSDDPVTVPSGDAQRLSASDIAPKTLRGTPNSEVWSYNFVFDGGRQAALSFRRADFSGLIGQVCGAELALIGFESQAIRAAKQYDAEQFAYDASTHRLSVNPRIFFEGALPQAHRVRFEAGKDDRRYTLDLTFSGIAQGLTWGSGEFRLGSERFGLFVHIPFARVSGFVEIDGERTDVSGVAYMDHTYQTGKPSSVIGAAYRYVSYDGGAVEAGNIFLPGDDYEQRPVGFGIVREGGQTRLLKPAAVTVVSAASARGATVPRQLSIAYQGGRQTVLSRDRDRQSFSTLEELGGITRSLARRFLGGEAMIFRGRGTVGSGAAAYYEYLVVK